MKHLKRITSEEAENYIEWTSDLLDSDPKFYTIAPSSDPIQDEESPWEDVKYYTGRSKTLQYTPETGKQYIYILSNEYMPGLIKIGYTKNPPGTRVKQLNTTGVPVDFNVEWAFPCFNGIQLEQEVHEYLADFRVNKKREFFNISIEEAKMTIEKLGKKYI